MTEKEVNISAINHCDYESCDLGNLALDCPICENGISDLENWFSFTGWGNQPMELLFYCNGCKANFKLHKKNNRYVYIGD